MQYWKMLDVRDVDSEGPFTAKLHYTDTGYEHQLRTPPTDKNLPHPKFPTSGHVEMLGSGIAMWQICYRIVVSLSVGGVRSRCPCRGVWLLRMDGPVVRMFQ